MPRILFASPPAFLLTPGVLDVLLPFPVDDNLLPKSSASESDAAIPMLPNPIIVEKNLRRSKPSDAPVSPSFSAPGGFNECSNFCRRLEMPGFE